MIARVVVIADGSIGDLGPRVAAIVAAVPRGAVAFQVRDKALEGGPLLQVVRDVLAVARPAGAPVWVNDRVDIAQIAGVHGVHLPEAGLPIRVARALVGDAFYLGASRHSAEAAIAAAADGADAVQLGPIFATPGKSPVGPNVLGVRRQLPSTTRLFAVGGIRGPEQARAAVAAGADGVAVIRAWRGPDAAKLVASIVAAVESGLG